MKVQNPVCDVFIVLWVDRKACMVTAVIELPLDLYGSQNDFFCGTYASFCDSVLESSGKTH